MSTERGRGSKMIVMTSWCPSSFSMCTYLHKGHSLHCDIVMLLHHFDETVTDALNFCFGRKQIFLTKQNKDGLLWGKHSTTIATQTKKIKVSSSYRIAKPLVSPGKEVQSLAEGWKRADNATIASCHAPLDKILELTLAAIDLQKIISMGIHLKLVPHFKSVHDLTINLK